MRAAKVQASLRIRAVSPEPPLLAHTSSESRGTFRRKARSLAPLNGWACAVKICHDGMLEDTNSLDAAQLSRRKSSVQLAECSHGIWEVLCSSTGWAMRHTDKVDAQLFALPVLVTSDLDTYDILKPCRPQLNRNQPHTSNTFRIKHYIEYRSRENVTLKCE